MTGVQRTSLDSVNPNYHHEEVGITDEARLRSYYGEGLVSYYQSDSETTYGGGSGQTTGQTRWGKIAGGSGHTNVSIESTYEYEWETVDFTHTGESTRSTAFVEAWTQPAIGGATSGGVTVDTSTFDWEYETQSLYSGGHSEYDSDSNTSLPNATNTLYALEFEIGWDPEELIDLADDLPYASVAGVNGFSNWSGALFGSEGTIAYTPPPGSEPEEPEEEEGESWGHFAAGFIPVYGSARDMYNSYQEGSYGWAAFNAAMLAVDLTGVGALAKMGAKAGVKLTATAAKSLLNKGAKETIETGVKKGIQAAGSLGDNVAGAAKGLADDVVDAGKAVRPQCFPAGTLVSTEQGQQPIEQIEPGQRVWAIDLTDAQWKLRPVLETYQVVSKPM